MKRRQLTWAQEQRQGFIAKCLLNPGFINRSDLMDEFRVSMPQASIDLQRFRRAHRGYMVYNASQKRYELSRTVRRNQD